MNTTRTDTVDMPLIGRAAEVMVDSVDAAERTIQVVWTTGATVQRVRYVGWDTRIEYDEELSIDPAHIRLDRLNAGAPFLNGHNGHSLETVLGAVVPGSARISGGKGHATIRMTSADDAAPLVQRIMDRSVRHVSVGYRVHAYEVTKGTDGKRERWRAVDWEPMEISAVPIPADPGAHIRSQDAAGRANQCTLIRVGDNAADAESQQERAMDEKQTAANPQIETRAEQHEAPPAAVETVARNAARQEAAQITELCIRHGMADMAPDLIARGGLDSARAAILDQMATRDSAAGARSAPATVRGSQMDEVTTQRRGMEEALVARVNRTAPASDVARPYMEMALVEMAASRLGVTKMPFSFGGREAIIRRAFHSTSDFPAIFENTLQRTLAARYAMAEPTYRQIAKQRRYANFQAHPTIRAGDFPMLKEVSAEGGEIKGGTFSENKEVTSVKTYGTRLDFTLAMLVNDTLGAIPDVLADQGRTIARFEEKTFYEMALGGAGANGPTLLETGRQMFNATDGTLAGTAAIISVDSLKLATAAIMKRKTKDGNDLSATPTIILTGPDRYNDAKQVVAPIQALEAGKVNPFSGMLRVVPTARITGNAWYVFADPADVANFEWGLLDGYEAPQFRVDQPFGYLGQSVSLVHHFGCGAIDFRGGYKNAGA